MGSWQAILAAAGYALGGALVGWGLRGLRRAGRPAATPERQAAHPAAATPPPQYPIAVPAPMRDARPPPESPRLAELQRAIEAVDARLVGIEAALAAQAGPAPAWAARDDLQELRGVGPLLERWLNERGVYRFRQLAAWQQADLDALLTGLPQFKGRLRLEQLTAQAREAHARKYGEAS
jgi:predicted flap endonuclease-1-like 5' DNA nuclease